MKHRSKAKTGDLRLVSDRTMEPAERAAAASRLAADGRFDLQATIEDLLDDADPVVRSTAIGILLGQWRVEALADRAMAMMRHDAAWDARAGAAMAIGSYARRLAPVDEHRRSFVRALVAALQTEDDLSVQATLYEEILRLVSDGDGWLGLPLDFDRERDVDWSALAPYMDE